MKLKNSYVLLIVMSIFLLVSIGSVCASDSAMDADVKLADDGSNELLQANDTDSASPVKTTIESQDTRINYGDAQKIPVNVKGNDSQSVDVTAKDLNVTENNKAVKFTYANSSITLTDKLSAGTHKLLISFLGNANYSSSSKTITLSVVGDNTLDVPSSIEVSNSTKKASIPIKITNGVDSFDVVKENLTVIASYKDGNETINKTINFELANKIITFDYDLDVNSCNIIVLYNDNNKMLNKTIAVKVVVNGKIIILKNESYYGSGDFKFQIVDENNNPLADQTVTISGYKNSTQIVWIINHESGSMSLSTSTTLKSDANGIVTMENMNFYPGYYLSGGVVSSPIGEYSLTITGKDTLKASKTTKIIIKKANINIKINEYKQIAHSQKQATINVTNANTGEAVRGAILHLYMPNTTSKDFYFLTGENGIASINVSGLIAGTYPLTVSNNDTDNINNKSVSGNIVILAVPVKYTVSLPSTYYYNTGNVATITVTDKATGKIVPNAIVLIQVYTGQKYEAYLYQANSKGKVYVNYAPASVGKHRIVVSSADSRYSASSVSKTITVKKASAKISSPQVTAYYKGGKYLTIKVVNSKNKKAVYGAKLNIKIFISKNRYYQYTGQTGTNGQTRILLDSFKPGTYNVIIAKGESTNYTASQITTKFVIKKAPTKFYPTKLTVKKGVSKAFKVTVKNTKTKQVIKGVKVNIKVYTGKTYKTYTVKTDSKGIAKLNAKSLKVGTHKVVITSANQYCTAKSATSSIKITK